ncbi:hypothetical protein NYE70_11425 [Paenibacillus sp. FSL R5-0407]|uniref:hypothetical protein n=1 Tax=Paenibacillus sp. FSL R5-0407 TaxID=2975320 RepID=UPI0030FAADEE
MLENVVEQLDLFGGADLNQQPEPAEKVLNGMYYEQSTGLFVSYVLGRRHFEVTPVECLGDKAWQEKTKRERAI